MEAKLTYITHVRFVYRNALMRAPEMIDRDVIIEFISYVSVLLSMLRLSDQIKVSDRNTNALLGTHS